MATPVAKLMQIRELIESGRHEQALPLLQRLFPQHAGDGPSNNAMAICLSSLAQYPKAEFFARRAVQASPSDAACQSTCGNILAIQHKYQEAIPFFEKSLALQPDNPHAALGLANALNGSNQPTRALEIIAPAARAHPEDVSLPSTLGTTLQLLGRPEEAFAAFRQMTTRFPAFVTGHTALAFSSNFAPGISREDVLAIHRAYGEGLSRTMPTPSRAFRGDRSPDRRLRVGVVSPDFRVHSVAFFLDAIYEKLDRSQFELLSYYTTSNTDALTERFRARSAEWRAVAGVPDQHLAERIVADRVDVLFETSGHTAGHSLKAFHLRPAPVQVAYCGYPNTAGVAAIDYRFVDSLTDPPGAEAFHTEKLVRLDPCFLCFTPPNNAPAPGPAHDGPVRFGSFNATNKINDFTIALWSQVLAAVPGSRLTLKALALADRKLCEALAARFASRGIDPARLEFLPPTKSQNDHLAKYHAVDVGLDPFPYHGTTTTCDAMFMGVPVVSLAGDRHASRVGVSLLNAVGLGDLVGETPEQFVQIATTLAQDRARLADLRTTLRDRMLASPLCDATGFAARFGTAIRGVWREYCSKAQ